MGFPKEMEPRIREEEDNPKRGRAGYRLRVGKGKEKPVPLNIEEGGASREAGGEGRAVSRGWALRSRLRGGA